jgi:protoporphyrinogen oxidase
MLVLAIQHKALISINKTGFKGKMASLNGKNIIIGAGLTGLSAAYHLKGNYALFEKSLVPGGMASSEDVKGFVFDKAGHLMHFQTQYAKNLIESIKNGIAFNRHKRFSWILSKNTYTRYPFQANTYKLPPPVIKDCLVKMARAQAYYKKRNSADNLQDWILENFGEGIARHFMFPYNRKLWQIPLRRIGIDWVDKFIPKAQLKCAIRGAVSDCKKGFGYNKVFYYPDTGGIQAVSEAFFSMVQNKVFFGREITGIDLKNKALFFSHGEKMRFNRIISTMPLPELIRMIKDVPLDIRAEIDNLKYASVFNLNLGIDRDSISDKHWIYFPEKKYVFYRIGFFSNFSKKVCPTGKSSLYAEVSCAMDKPLKCARHELKRRIIQDLNKSGILKTSDKIIAEKSYYIKYAYPVSGKSFTLDIIDKFLKSHNVHSVGRYGSWKYMSMEECIMQGKLTADHINGL